MNRRTKIRVLFVCVHNSARSQMAEALLRELGGERFEVFSAGLEPGELNPLAVQVMEELGIDISGHKVKSVFDHFRQGVLFDYVITVCDAARAEKCPVFPGVTKRLEWSFEDPASLAGDWESRLAATRRIRDGIREAVRTFVAAT